MHILNHPAFPLPETNFGMEKKEVAGSFNTSISH